MEQSLTPGNARWALRRTIVPEILDGLDPHDPGAIRSRRDLRTIDCVMGNSRWIRGRVRRERALHQAGVVELGAGDGRLCAGLASDLVEGKVTGLDLMPPPGDLPPAARWKSGNFFESLPGMEGGIVVGSLILHHFEDVGLEALGRELGRFRVLIFCEPWRSRWALALAALATPLAGRVTRHDMPASIRAGFRPGELAQRLLGGGEGWKISESIRASGGVRFQAWRDT